MKLPFADGSFGSEADLVSTSALINSARNCVQSSAAPATLVAGIVITLAGVVSRSAYAQDVSPGESPGLQQLAVAYYANKYRVEPEEALRKITIQDKAAGIENDLVRLLDNHYAGI